jgi:hypothetical protein
MRRIAVVTQAVAFIVTGLLVLFALGLLATKQNGPPRAAIPELILLGIAIIAFLLASKPYVDADAEEPAKPVEVRLWDPQVDLLARIVDSLAERTAQHPGPKPIPDMTYAPTLPPDGLGVDTPPQVRETRLPRPRRGAHRASPR